MAQPNGKNPLSYLGVRAEDPSNLIEAERAPGNNDVYDIGTVWIDTTTNAVYFLTSFSSGIPNWEIAASPTGAISQLDGDSGSATPAAGVITIAGGANITTSATGSTVTAALDAAVTTTSYATADAADGLTITSNGISADGTNADIDIVVTPKGAGNLDVAAGDVSISSLGSGLSIAEGADARMGVATLTAGTVTVSTTAVAANSRVFLTRQDLNSATAVGSPTLGTVTAGTSFVINSLDATASVETNDVSIIAWMIVNPA